MLFLMPYESFWSIWMFGMNYPLWIIFLDKNKIIIDIKYAEPMTFNPKTWKIYNPKNPCKYILELTEKFNINIGDKLEW